MAIEKLSSTVQRAWAVNGRCDWGGTCDAPPTHKVWYRRKSNQFRLACDRHAQELSEREQIPISDRP